MRREWLEQEPERDEKGKWAGEGGRLRNRNHTSGQSEREQKEGGEKGQQLKRMRE